MNLCLNTLLIAFTGKRNIPLCFDGFQQSASLKPPPGTIICTWGCRLRFCPQVCKTVIIPGDAPRCLGSAAKASIVSLELTNRRLYNAAGCFKQYTFSSWGNVNTTWK